MRPKEKAKILVEKNQGILSKHIFNGTYDIAIELALLCVDEMLNCNTTSVYYEEDFEYWKKVKQEIDKL